MHPAVLSVIATMLVTFVMVRIKNRIAMVVSLAAIGGLCYLLMENT